MPRNGSGVYSLPADTSAVSGTLANSSDVNDRFADLAAENNDARPLTAGGTGANSAAGARDNLDIDSKVIAKSGNYTALAGDRSKLIVFSASATLSLTAAASLTDGWYVDVRADGADVVVDPNGSETINGGTSVTVPRGSSLRVHCDGTSFHTSTVVEITNFKTVSSARTIVLSDNLALLRVSSLLTLPLDGPSTLGNGFWVDVEAASGAVIDGDGALINGAATLTLLPNQVARIYCDGAGFFASIIPAFSPEVINITSNTSELVFDVPVGAHGFRLSYDHFLPVDNNATLVMQFGQNGSGGAFVGAASYYFLGVNFLIASTANYQNTTSDNVPVSAPIDSSTGFNGAGFGEVRCQGLRRSDGGPNSFVDRYGFGAGVNLGSRLFSRMVGTSLMDFNAVRFFVDSGDIARLNGVIEWTY